jgi:hypothetical protein
MKKGLYENKLGVQLELFDFNEDVFGNKYCTWRWVDDGRTYNVRVESFKGMIKANHYELVEER